MPLQLEDFTSVLLVSKTKPASHSAISSAGGVAVAVGAAGALVVPLPGGSPFVAGACAGAADGAADDGEDRGGGTAADVASGFSAGAVLERGRGADSIRCGFAVAWIEPGCVPGSTTTRVPMLTRL